jgi:hypothetical protein
MRYEARVQEGGGACVEQRGAQGEGEEGGGPVEQACPEEEGRYNLLRVRGWGEGLG